MRYYDCVSEYVITVFSVEPVDPLKECLTSIEQKESTVLTLIFFEQLQVFFTKKHAKVNLKGHIPNILYIIN